jgi:hypothetical protein
MNTDDLQNDASDDEQMNKRIDDTNKKNKRVDHNKTSNSSSEDYDPATSLIKREQRPEKSLFNF